MSRSEQLMKRWSRSSSVWSQRRQLKTSFDLSKPRLLRSILVKTFSLRAHHINDCTLGGARPFQAKVLIEVLYSCWLRTNSTIDLTEYLPDESLDHNSSYSSSRGARILPIGQTNHLYFLVHKADLFDAILNNLGNLSFSGLFPNQVSFQKKGLISFPN